MRSNHVTTKNWNRCTVRNFRAAPDVRILWKDFENARLTGKERSKKAVKGISYLESHAQTEKRFCQLRCIHRLWINAFCKFFRIPDAKYSRERIRTLVDVFYEHVTRIIQNILKLRWYRNDWSTLNYHDYTGENLNDFKNQNSVQVQESVLKNCKIFGIDGKDI